MSTIGVTPGVQGGTKGVGKIWPMKRIISQKEETEKQGEILEYVQETGEGIIGTDK